MEGHIIYIILLIVCLGLITVNSDGPEFLKVTTGEVKLDEGVTTHIICTVDEPEDYSTAWYRKTPVGNRQAIYRDGRLINNNLGREAEAYSLHRNYNVIIKQVRGRDLGRLLDGNIYTCEVTEKDTGKVLVSTGVILDARYSPSSLYPICEACRFSSELINSNVTISCYSEIGNPHFQLKWSRNGQAIENLQTTMTHSFIYLNYTFILEAEDLESNFSCTNSKNSCNLNTNHSRTEESFPTMLLETDTSSTVTVQTDKTSAEERNLTPDSAFSNKILTVIGASIGAVLFLVLCLLSVICFYKRRDTKQRDTTTLQEQSTNEESLGVSNRNEFTIDNASNNEYAQVIARNRAECGTVENEIYVAGYDSGEDNVETAYPLSNVNDPEPKPTELSNYYSNIGGIES